MTKKRGFGIAALAAMAVVACRGETYRTPDGEPFVLGYHLDISRDKVPTMASLYRLVDILAGQGFNQLQLYAEHTFAYKGHEKVWGQASPMTAEEIRALDDYCWKKGVALVPNQNSFGHMERWLKHPEYRHLAESPEGGRNPWGGRAQFPRALCPTDPASERFLASLYDELLPNFRHTKLLHIGCDEVWDIESGGDRSAAAVKEKGAARVYCDFVRKIQKLAADRGRTVMYWGDFIVAYPDMVREMPKDAVMIVCSYDQDTPYDKRCAKPESLGRKYYIGPGTSSWYALFGKWTNARRNIANAFAAGRRHGMSGCLLCDWGDGGYPHPYIVSLPPIVYAAGEAKGRQMTDDEVAAEVDRICGCRCGKALLRYGDLYRMAYCHTPNSTALYKMLADRETYKYTYAQNEGRMGELFDELHDIMTSVDLTNAPDWVKEDFAMLELLGKALEMAYHKQESRILSEIPGPYRRLWLKQNRPGGLEDSVQRLFLHGQKEPEKKEMR